MTVNIPRFWSRAHVDERGHEVDPPRGFIAFGWSDHNIAAAHEMAVERARRAAKFVLNASDSQRQRMASEAWGVGYEYPRQPIREEVVQRDDQQGWAITRNAYGSLVLNTEAVMFIDMDLPPQPLPRGCLGFLFVSSKPAADHGTTIVDRAREVVESLDGMGLRLYRTAAGFRALVTTETFDPTSSLAADMLAAFHADRQYANLCKAQQCFRARLTPKPWRCDHFPRATARFPYRSDKEAALMQDWVRRYEQARRNYGVCELVEIIGSRHISERVRPIMELHDQHVINPGHPLA